MRRGEKLPEVIRRLLRRLSQLGVSVRMLLLDRGFWSVGVIRYLQRARFPFLMPVVLRGRPADHPRGPGGTRVFAGRKRGGWDEYTLTAADKQTARVSICIHCRNYNGQWGRHGRQTLVYAFWGIQPANTGWVRETYRKRFAIETSYRQMLQGKAHVYAQPGGAVVAGGGGVGVAQRVGVVALHGALDASSWQPEVQSGTTDLGDAAALAAPPGGTGIGLP